MQNEVQDTVQEIPAEVAPVQNQPDLQAPKASVVGNQPLNTDAGKGSRKLMMIAILLVLFVLVGGVFTVVGTDIFKGPKDKQLVSFANDVVKPEVKVASVKAPERKEAPGVGKVAFESVEEKGDGVWTVSRVESPHGKLLVNYMIVEEKGKTSGDFDAVIAIFNKYFQMPDATKDSWKIIDSYGGAVGITAYEIVTDNTDGSYSTRTGYSTSYKDGSYDIAVGACTSYPGDPDFDKHSCLR